MLLLAPFRGCAAEARSTPETCQRAAAVAPPAPRYGPSGVARATAPLGHRPARKLPAAVKNSSGASTCGKWPAPGTTTRRASGSAWSRLGTVHGRDVAIAVDHQHGHGETGQRGPQVPVAQGLASALCLAQATHGLQRRIAHVSLHPGLAGRGGEARLEHDVPERAAAVEPESPPLRQWQEVGQQVRVVQPRPAMNYHGGCTRPCSQVEVQRGTAGARKLPLRRRRRQRSGAAHRRNGLSRLPGRVR
jgi:hypothetical protein